MESVVVWDGAIKVSKWGEKQLNEQLRILKIDS
jgi:hypothetical protein